MDQDPMAAARFMRLVQGYVKGGRDLIAHDITPADVDDWTEISQRIYGNRDEILTVMACAGLTNTAERLTQKRIYLPSPVALVSLKRKAGFESRHDLRADGAPTWM